MKDTPETDDPGFTFGQMLAAVFVAVVSLAAVAAVLT